MSLKACVLPLLVVFVGGCAAPELPPVTSVHPASPSAESAPLPPPSDTLEVRDPVEAPSMPPMQGSHGPMEME